MIKKMMKNKIWRTFWQAFLGTIATGIVGSVTGVHDVEALRWAILTLIASAFSAGLCAVMNKEKRDDN